LGNDWELIATITQIAGVLIVGAATFYLALEKILKRF